MKLSGIFEAFRKRNSVLPPQQDLAPMTHPAFDFLGHQITDKVTGLTGYCTSIAQKTNGMHQACVQPKGDGTTYPEPWAFDVDNLSINEGSDRLKVTPIEITPFPLLTLVKSNVSGIQGRVSEIAWMVNGCLVYSVTTPPNSENKVQVVTMYHETTTVVPETVTPATPPVKRTGGPVTRAMRL